RPADSSTRRAMTCGVSSEQPLSMTVIAKSNSDSVLAVRMLRTQRSSIAARLCVAISTSISMNSFGFDQDCAPQWRPSFRHLMPDRFDLGQNGDVRVGVRLIELFYPPLMKPSFFQKTFDGCRAVESEMGW